jgi:hypothetical protein
VPALRPWIGDPGMAVVSAEQQLTRESIDAVKLVSISGVKRSGY